MLAIMWIFRRGNPHRANRGFRVAQTVSAAALALGHGLQDAQKTMGVIFLALVAGGYVSDSDGPAAVGDLRRRRRDLARHLLRRLADHAHPRPPDHPPRPARGFSAEAVAASVLYTTAFVFQAPISTTHTITSAVMGAGATKRFSAVRWGVARSILTAWVLTFPMAAGAAAALLLRRPLLHRGRLTPVGIAGGRR